MPKGAEQRRWFALILCLLIALLALHAKLALYDQPAGPASIVSLKMWVDGQRTQSQSLQPLPLLPAFFGVLAFLTIVFSLRKTPFAKPVPDAERSSRLEAFQFERYLRPPPFLFLG